MRLAGSSASCALLQASRNQRSSQTRGDDSRGHIALARRDFDPRRFSDIVLGAGARPLDRMCADVVRWVSSGGARSAFR